MVPGSPSRAFMMPIELRWTTPSTVRMGTLPPSRPPSPKPSGQVVGSAISTSTRVYCSRTTPVSSWGSSSTASSAPPRGSRLGGGGGGGDRYTHLRLAREIESGGERGGERERRTHIYCGCVRVRAQARALLLLPRLRIAPRRLRRVSVSHESGSVGSPMSASAMATRWE